MTALQLYFLGPLDIRCGYLQLPRPPTLKSQSLLAYLVLHRCQPQPRERLVGLFWGDCVERKARHSLSTALWRIRRCLPDESVLLNESRTIQFDPQADFWLDVEEFEAQAAHLDTASLEAAVTLYRSDFLDGFYDDWILSERYRLEALYLETLARLMCIHEAGSDYQAALATALRLLNRDSLREDAHRLAMRAYCQLGQRKSALEQYQACRDTVRKELGAQPMVETTELYQEILEGRFKAQHFPEIYPVTTSLAEPAGRNPLDMIAPVRLVGREREMAIIEDDWRKAQKGSGSLLLVAGEVGVGKTHLVEAFANRLRWQHVRVLWGRCYEFERTLPYQPITGALRVFLPTFPDEEMVEIPAWALRELARLAPDLLERPGLRLTYPELLREIAGNPGPEIQSIPGFDLEQARLFEGVARVFADVSSHEALLVVLEDLHWASESTLQLLHHLVHRLSDHPVLLIGTFRPEATGLQHSLSDLRRKLSREGLAQQLDLPRLSYAAVETILMEMSGAGNAVLPLAERLFRETEGNPFFLMEIVKALFETNVIQLKDGVWQGDFHQVGELGLPLSANLSEAILARAQRLGEDAQEALRLAAVLGREFNYELLDATWGKGEDATLEALDELLRHRLVEERCGPNERDFAFTHHKIQEVVYQSLPRHRCLHWHAQVGAAMESLAAYELETRAGELAYHFEQACLLEPSLSAKAIRYLLQAGQQAVRQFANQEAVGYYQRGLGVLRSQAETAERMQQEVELQLALAVPITVIRGYTSPETKSVYGRARELCQKLGEMPDLFTSLVGLCRYYDLSGDLNTGDKLAEQLLGIARKAGDADLLLEAYRQYGGRSFVKSRLREARAFFEAGLALYDLSKHESYAYRFGHDPAATCLSYLSITLWLLGYPEQALEQSQNLCNLIPSLTHPASRVYAYCQLATQACLRHSAKEAQDHAEAAIQIGYLHHTTIWTIWATVLKGWALFEQKQRTQGLALLREGTQAWRLRGFAHFTPFFLSLQAGACLKVGMVKDGLEAISAGLALVQGGVDRYWEAELIRLRGELRRAVDLDSSIAECDFRQAMATAHQQGARMHELRAATNLARLWRDRGQVQEAQQVLRQVYNGFDEGFLTQDLREAQALLRELSLV